MLSAKMFTIFSCLLQALWSWLWDAKHTISKDDRPALLRLFRQVLYSENESDLSENLENVYASSVSLKYPNFQAHLMFDIFPKMKAWCMEHRVTNKLPTSNNNTNNLVETSFRYTKENQLNRHKAYNLCDLLSLLLDNSDFYQNKCVDCANNVLESWLRNCHSKYVVSKQPNIDPDHIEQVGPNSFLVPSETQPDIRYLVDMDIRHCSCPVGRLLGPCKHKRIVSVSQNVNSFDVLPTTNPQMRRTFMELATGRKMSLDYFLPMQAPDMAESGDVIPSSTPAPYEGTDTGAPADEGHTAPVVQQDNVGVVNEAEVRYRLSSTLQVLHDKLAARISHDPTGYQKAVADLEKTVQKLPTTSDSALQKCLHSFGKSVTQVKFNIRKISPLNISLSGLHN